MAAAEPGVKLELVVSSGTWNPARAPPKITVYGPPALVPGLLLPSTVTQPPLPCTLARPSNAVCTCKAVAL